MSETETSQQLNTAVQDLNGKQAYVLVTFLPGEEDPVVVTNVQEVTTIGSLLQAVWMEMMVQSNVSIVRMPPPEEHAQPTQNRT